MTRRSTLWCVALCACAAAPPSKSSHQGPITSILPDGSGLRTASQAGITLVTGETSRLVITPDRRIVALAHDMDRGVWFGAGGIPGECGTLIAWQGETEVARADIADDMLTALLFDPSDRTLITGGEDGAVLACDAGSLAVRRVLRRHEGGVRALASSGALLASAGLDGDLMLGPRDETPRSLRAHAAGIVAMAWSRDGSELATAAQDGRVRHFDRDGRLLRASEVLRQRLLCLCALTAERPRFASGDAAGAIRVHDADGTRMLDVGDGDPVFALFERSDQLFCGRCDRLTSLRLSR